MTGMVILTRPNWPAYRCPQSGDSVHRLERMGAEAYCPDCFHHFLLAEFDETKAGAVFVEGRRQLAIGWHGGLN